MILPHECQVRYSARDEWLEEKELASSSWLGGAESRELDRLRYARRRQQWLQGRRVSKQLICETLGVAMADIQILTRDDQQRSVRPRTYVGSQQLNWSLSISHSDTGVLVSLAATDQFAVGVDLANDVPCNRGFHELWFTPRERCWLQQDARPRTTLLWGIKEAVYKACNAGESWTPRAVEVLPQADESFQCLYRETALRGLCIDVMDMNGQLAIVACIPQAALAPSMNAPAHSPAFVGESRDEYSATRWTPSAAPHSSKSEAMASCL